MEDKKKKIEVSISSDDIRLDRKDIAKQMEKLQGYIKKTEGQISRLEKEINEVRETKEQKKIKDGIKMLGMGSEISKNA